MWRLYQITTKHEKCIKEKEVSMAWTKKECVVVPTDFSEISLKALDVANQFVDLIKRYT